MKLLVLLAVFFLQQSSYSQRPVTVIFSNDYDDVYHLSLVIYTPDGKVQTRVSNLEPRQRKTYALPAGTEIFVADWKQEAFAMKGNDIKATGIKPDFVLNDDRKNLLVPLSTLGKNQVGSKQNK